MQNFVDSNQVLVLIGILITAGLILFTFLRFLFRRKT